MYSQFDILESLLKGKKRMSFKNLKDKLNFATDEEFMNFLLTYLDSAIETFNYNTIYQKNKLLKKLMNYIDYDHNQLDLCEQNYKTMYCNLTTIKEKIEVLLNSPIEIYSKTNTFKNKKLLTRIVDRIDLINKRLEKKGMADLQHNLEMYNFMLELLNNEKTYSYIQKLIIDNPSIVNLQVDDCYLVEKVLYKFINAFEKDLSYHTKLFYSKILKLFLENNNFDVDIIGLQSIYNKKIYKILENHSLSSYEKKGEIYLIREINQAFISREKTILDLKKEKENLELKYQLRHDFDEKEKDELNFLIKINPQDYIEHRSLDNITIDSPKTNCFEDALCLIKKNDGYIFRLYSSDVNAFIFENFYLERRAFNNALTYFLPENIINDYLSLTKNKDAYTICHEFHLDNNLNVLDFKVYKALINVKENYHYADIKEDMLVTDSTIKQLYLFSRKLNAKHMNQTFKKDADYLQELHQDKKCHIGPDIIRECGMFVNFYIANNLDLPFIYRKRSFYDEIVKSKVNSCFSNVKRKTDINSSIKEIKAKNIYYGEVDIKKYADFCSPIRKYDAMWNERVLLNRHDKKKIDYYRLRVLDVCELLNDKLERISDYEKEVKLLTKKYHKKVDKK